MQKKEIIIVGGGPAGLMAAVLLSSKYKVSIFDAAKTIGQKFLVAGKGGFNLTNSLQGNELRRKYTPSGFMDKSLSEFDTVALRHWLSDLGIPTFTGSSGRVFPEKGIRPTDVLNKIKAKLIAQGVNFYLNNEFTGFDNNKCITFKTKEKEITEEADYIIFSLGGASWPVTGSTGLWRSIFETRGIKTKTFESSNCGVNISWPEEIRKHHEGKPLKNIRLFTDENEHPGEALITNYGLEGNALYPLVPGIRNSLNMHKPAFLFIDIKPSLTVEQLLQKAGGKVVKTQNYGQIFNLSTVQIAILKAFTSKETFQSVTGFIHSIKKTAIPIDSLRPIEEAISTIGGISLEEVNDDFSLKKYPWIYTIGEMLDWDAPTGGFLIQGCFSMGHLAASSILEGLNNSLTV